MKYLCLIVVLFLVGNASANRNSGNSTIDRPKRGFPILTSLQTVCSKPCKCTGMEKNETCAEGVSLIKDGCGCCYICARQQGERCGEEFPCDANLQCNINTQRCEAIDHCYYKRTRMNIGEEIRVNCRKNCTCQSSSKVTCTNICSQIRRQKNPIPGCKNPWYNKKDSSSCCGKWECADDQPKPSETSQRCKPHVTEWSNCSQPICGVGVSKRNETRSDCTQKLGKRLCEIRTCAMANFNLTDTSICNVHTVKRVFLEIGSLKSVKKYKMRYCNNCPLLDCKPVKTKTFTARFHRVGRNELNSSDTSYSPRVIRKKVMKIKRCKCTVTSPEDTFIVNKLPEGDEFPVGRGA